MHDGPACCAPRAGTPPGEATEAVRGLPLAAPSAGPARSPGAERPHDLVPLDGGEFVMGHDGPDGYPEDGEGPAHRVRLRPFRIDRCAVSNARFGRFVDATGYRTAAEVSGWSFVFGGLLPDDFPPTRGVSSAPWWRVVEGASWRAPEGPGSHVRERARHPVVHVSWHDAAAYADWSGLRLPTEAEWEHAARAGLAGVHYPWGAEREPGGVHRMNVWQGTFPSRNTRDDGWYGTAPVDEYPPNAFGLHNMTGNVWEWCSDRFAVDTYRRSPAHDPAGPETGDARVLRGGSYLCHASYCFRYRVDARSSSTPGSPAGNVGFRCAADG
ncbi:formylglycine-generating enzyme family protein [Cellulosimicrobium sp. Marseille-Q8652]